MCYFFACVCNGKQIYYFNWKQRQAFLAGNLKIEDPDSHTSIADYYGFKGEKEDALGKYEYNPLTEIFTKDRSAGEEIDSFAYSEIMKLDWKKICEPLIIKDIVDVTLPPKRKPGKRDLQRLKKWASVRNAIGASGDQYSVISRVGDYVGGNVWPPVREAVMDGVGACVWDNANAGAFAWIPACDSAWDSGWAYASSFFDVKQDYDLSPLIELRERGFVPVFDGDGWYLISGGEVVWKGKIT